MHSMDQRLSFLGLTGQRSADGHLLAEYRCSCGNIVVVRRSRVKNGYTRSCGCLSADTKPGLRHGMRNSPTYRSWSAMRTRCLNPNSKDYPRWGGAGVSVCERWASFEEFLADMGERPAGTTLDRIDPSQGYSAANCRWATPKEQARNRRDVVQVETANGTELLPDVAERMGLTRGAALMRLTRGKLEGVRRAA